MMVAVWAQLQSLPSTRSSSGPCLIVIQTSFTWRIMTDAPAIHCSAYGGIPLQGTCLPTYLGTEAWEIRTLSKEVRRQCKLHSLLSLYWSFIDYLICQTSMPCATVMQWYSHLYNSLPPPHAGDLFYSTQPKTSLTAIVLDRIPISVITRPTRSTIRSRVAAIIKRGLNTL